MSTMQLSNLLMYGPPSSPPMNYLLAIRMMKQMMATARKTNTEKATSPSGTSYYLPPFS